MHHLGTTVLETERLTLRRFEVRDARAVYENWAGDPEVTKYLTWTAHASPAVSRRILEEWVAGYRGDAFYQWAIAVRGNGSDPVGSIAVIDRDDAIGMVHIGYCIGRKWWRQGVTSEALGAVIAFFFDEVGANRVDSWHDPRNPNSGKVMAKCGMKYEGTLRQSDWNNQGVCDAAIYAILRKDYLAPPSL